MQVRILRQQGLISGLSVQNRPSSIRYGAKKRIDLAEYEHLPGPLHRYLVPQSRWSRFRKLLACNWAQWTSYHHLPQTPDDYRNLIHLRNAYFRATQFVCGVKGGKEFKMDREALAATVYQDIVIGEASKRLSPAFKNRNPFMVWKNFEQTRDKVHKAFEGVFPRGIFDTFWYHGGNTVLTLDAWLRKAVKGHTKKRFDLGDLTTAPQIIPFANQVPMFLDGKDHTNAGLTAFLVEPSYIAKRYLAQLPFYPKSIENDPEKSKLFKTLMHLETALACARHYVRGMSKDDFIRNVKTQSAVMAELAIVRVGIQRLPDKFKEAYPKTPWKAIYDMGSKLVHQFDTVDTTIVWDTLTKPKFLPTLQKQLGEMIQALAPDVLEGTAHVVMPSPEAMYDRLVEEIHE